MIDSYEPLTPVAVDVREVENRMRQVDEEWERHAAELRRIHPELDDEPRRGRVATPWTITKQ